MRKFAFLFTVISLVLVAFPAVAETNAPPEPITLEGPSFFPSPTNPGHGSFEATGPICESGSFEDLIGFAAPHHPVEPGFNLKIYRQYICDDQSGTFVMKLEVRVDNRRWPTFNWLVIDGTGAYEGLHANGSGYAAGPIFDGEGNVIGVMDVYEGKAH